MPSSPFDEARARELHAQGHSLTEIARIMDIPRSTLRDRMKAIGLVPNPPKVITSDGHPPLLPSLESELREMVTWWRERQEALQMTTYAPKETQRVTYHVEKRWIEAVRRMADLDSLTITEVVNLAFRSFFAQKYT
jgi:hypothetical protein